MTTDQARTSEGGHHLLPPPPSVYNRKERKSQCRGESTEQQNKAMPEFRASQRRYIRGLILADELGPSKEAESLNSQSDAELYLDIVLNGH
jgi:hypothetical protein